MVVALPYQGFRVSGRGSIQRTTGRRRLLALGLLCLVPASSKADVAAYWEELTPLPTPRQEVGVATMDHWVYVIGGILGDRSATGAVERYSVLSEEWEELLPLPEDTRLHHVGTAAALGKVFVIGGLDASFRGTQSVFAWDPASGSWERRADLPRPRGAMGVAAIDDHIYAVGGQHGSTSFNDLFIYSVEQDQWVGPDDGILPMPTPRNHLAAASLDGLLYAVGGRSSTGLNDQLEVYSPDRNVWVELNPMPTARAGIAAAEVRGHIFVFGGEGNPDSPVGIFSQVERYEVCRDSWRTEEPMDNPRHGIGAASVDDAVYIPGGSPVQGFGTTDLHEVYFPGSVGPGAPTFLRGDANLDRAVDMSDAVTILSFLFLEGSPLPCPDAADADDQGVIQITDPIFLLNFLFLGGPEPPHPGPYTPGVDLTSDSLDMCGGPVECIEPF